MELGVCNMSGANLRPLNPAECCSLFALWSRVIQVFHTHHLSHLDVKPVNFLVSAMDGRCMLADFEGCRQVSSRGYSTTVSASLRYTMAYVDPALLERYGRASETFRLSNGERVRALHFDIFSLAMSFLSIAMREEHLEPNHVVSVPWRDFLNPSLNFKDSEVVQHVSQVTDSHAFAQHLVNLCRSMMLPVAERWTANRVAQTLQTWASDTNSWQVQASTPVGSEQWHELSQALVNITADLDSLNSDIQGPALRWLLSLRTEDIELLESMDYGTMFTVGRSLCSCLGTAIPPGFLEEIFSFALQFLPVCAGFVVELFVRVQHMQVRVKRDINMLSRLGQEVVGNGYIDYHNVDAELYLTHMRMVERVFLDPPVRMAPVLDVLQTYIRGAARQNPRFVQQFLRDLQEVEETCPQLVRVARKAVEDVRA
jgi:hypothetical protein